MKKVGIGIVALASVVLISGCAKTTGERDAMETRDPLVRSALAKADQGDKDSAILLLMKSLDKNPGSALSHLRIALLYDDHARDYARAIYHYRRYLELRPETEKRDMIVGRIRDAELRFCTSLPGRLSSGEQDCASIKAENARLKGELIQLRQSLAQATASQATASQATVAAPENKTQSDPRPPAAGASDARKGSPGSGSYIVQPNDTLSAISAKVYEDPRAWKRIHDANRDIIGEDPRGLKTGQELIIPKL